MKNEFETKQLFDLPNEILRITENAKYNDLLSENICNIYYYPNLKKELSYFITKYNDLKYFYEYSNMYNITNHISFENISPLKGRSDKVSNFVAKNIDMQRYIEKIYYKFINLAHKLSVFESIYIVDTFFSNKTEEEISEKIGICRQTLQKIKKSSLVKLYLEFQDEI